MERFLTAVEQAMDHENWYAALVVSLILPDICSRLQEPDERASGPRYKRWCAEYVVPAYTEEFGKHFAAGDVYALRCSLLHQGEEVVADQSASDILERFRFFRPQPGEIAIVDCISMSPHTKLILRVDIFCRNVVAGARRWQEDVAGTEVEGRMGELLEVRGHREGGAWRIG